MAKTHLKVVAAVSGHGQPKLTKGQQAFNKLIEQIEKTRTRLVDWEAAVLRYQKKYTGEFLPLVDNLMDSQVRMVHCLDQASVQKGLSKAERGDISGLIVDLADQLLSSRDDAELKAIYNKHSHSDYDQEAAEDIKHMKSVMEGVLGVDLGDDFDMSSEGDFLKRMQAKMQEEWEQENAKRQTWEERRPKRKKTAKQLAKEAQQQAEEQQISLSIREVYRKLASALHPDRETDTQERERKTALMQRVNEAYEKRNLLQLLKLQLELEHIDQNTVNNISEDRLKHYNKILKEQLVELEQEIFHVEDGFVMQFGIDPFKKVSPRTVMRHLASEIVEVQHTIRDIEKDMLEFEDIKKVKAWLKKMRRQAAEMDDFAGFDDFKDFGGFDDLKDCPF